MRADRHRALSLVRHHGTHPDSGRTEGLRGLPMPSGTQPGRPLGLHPGGGRHDQDADQGNHHHQAHRQVPLQLSAFHRHHRLPAGLRLHSLGQRPASARLQRGDFLHDRRLLDGHRGNPACRMVQQQQVLPDRGHAKRRPDDQLRTVHRAEPADDGRPLGHDADFGNRGRPERAVVHLQRPHPRPHRLCHLLDCRDGRDQPRSFRPAGSRKRADRRLPHRVLRDALRLLLRGRIRQYVHRRLHRHHRLPRRLDAFAHPRPGRLQPDHGLHSLRHLVLRQKRLDGVRHHVVQMDLPPFEDRPAAEPGMEIPPSAQLAEPLGDGSHRSIGVAFLRKFAKQGRGFQPAFPFR